MNIPDFIENYIRSKYAGEWALEGKRMETISSAIVIPAIAEYENIPLLIRSLAQSNKEALSKTAIIFVINNLSSSPDEIKENNRLTMQFIRQIMENNDYAGLNIFLVDAASSGKELPERDGGVGLARKIGMDLALTQFDYSSNEKKILICLDADCLVSTNYIESVVVEFNSRNLNAASIRFEHDVENAENPEAILCYEIFLRYYVLGLSYAGSPYAFHTIGSSMACDVESYIKIGGMNKRKAAEDFYFLEKLSKVVKIESINSAVVYPSARGSWRVPFGTGQRVNRFLAHTHDEYSLYSPESFLILKNWLSLFNVSKDSAFSILHEAEKISPALCHFLKEQKFGEHWGKILLNSKSEEQLSIQKKLWFDGFRNLKLIHYLRDNGFANMNMFDSIDELLKLMKINKPFNRDNCVPSLSIQKEYLLLLRKLNET